MVEQANLIQFGINVVQRLQGQYQLERLALVVPAASVVFAIEFFPAKLTCPGWAGFEWLFSGGQKQTLGGKCKFKQLGALTVFEVHTARKSAGGRSGNYHA
ncbi:hypothetical protein D3C77_523190 [compost metagenome]